MISTSTPTISPEICGNTAPYAQLMTVTPELAKRWLAGSNVKNRRLKPGHAAQIARDIRQGKWFITHQGIAFSSKGILVDGQHRLHAIIDAETSVQMFVWFNIDPKSLLVIDRNSLRSKCDAINLTADGGRVTESEVATLGLMLSGLGSPIALTSSEAEAAMTRHRAAINFAHTYLPASCRARNVACRATRAVIARAYYSANHDRLIQFCKVLRTGIAPQIDDQPAAMLYQHLTQAPRASGLQVKNQYSKVEKALSAFVLFEPMTRLSRTARELFPITEDGKR